MLKSSENTDVITREVSGKQLVNNNIPMAGIGDQTDGNFIAKIVLRNVSPLVEKDRIHNTTVVEDMLKNMVKLGETVRMIKSSKSFGTLPLDYVGFDDVRVVFGDQSGCIFVDRDNAFWVMIDGRWFVNSAVSFFDWTFVESHIIKETYGEEPFFSFVGKLL